MAYVLIIFIILQINFYLINLIIVFIKKMHSIIE